MLWKVPVRTTWTRRPWSVLLAIAVVAAVGGCTTSPDQVPTPTELPAAFHEGVPEPAGDVVLTVTTPSATHDWDLTTLQQLPQHDLTIVEPFVEEEHTYTGPLWADVLRASDVDLEATASVELTALDGFVADIPTDVATLDGLLLAHAEDGEEIPVRAGGPIRLVFPPDNPAGENANNWIWSVRTATVE